MLSDIFKIFVCEVVFELLIRTKNKTLIISIRLIAVIIETEFNEPAKLISTLQQT